MRKWLDGKNHARPQFPFRFSPASASASASAKLTLKTSSLHETDTCRKERFNAEPGHPDTNFLAQQACQPFQ